MDIIRWYSLPNSFVFHFSRIFFCWMTLIFLLFIHVNTTDVWVAAYYSLQSFNGEEFCHKWYILISVLSVKCFQRINNVLRPLVLKIFLSNYVSLFLGDTQIFLGDTQIFLGDTQIFLGDTQIFLGDTQIFLGDTQIFLGDTQIFLSDTQIFLGDTQII